MRNNFRVLLAKKRIKISDVHKITHISKSTLTNLYYERTKNPKSETLLKVANFLEVTIDELLATEQ
ncbi:helix-turn-helix domain-containing protein [Streptococcus uberis]|uniref:helix-turn-helix domain-containing protein n=1 Tax=Streptococcus uberis TaxID=1349 RepID=UPI0019392B56|nr:helix-turn-helix transcriptional regulator [Streptococcus uberis]